MRELWRSATLGVTQMLDSMKVLQESSGVLDPREANNVWDLSNLLDSHLLQVNPPSVNPRDLAYPFNPAIRSFTMGVIEVELKLLCVSLLSLRHCLTRI